MRVERMELVLKAEEETDPRRATFAYLLDEVVAEPAGRRLVDLGAGHCIFSRIARRCGYVVTAVDARDDRVRREQLGDIRFVQMDVRDYDFEGTDVVAVIGLLYHLTLEDQIQLMSRIAQHAEVVVVDTQVHIPELVVQEENQGLDDGRGGWQDRVVERSGYEGIVYVEKDNIQASVGNPTSWWHTADSLIRLFAATGWARLLVVDPPYVSKYGGRHWYVAWHRA